MRFVGAGGERFSDISELSLAVCVRDCRCDKQQSAGAGKGHELNRVSRLNVEG